MTVKFTQQHIILHVSNTQYVPVYIIIYNIQFTAYIWHFHSIAAPQEQQNVSFQPSMHPSSNCKLRSWWHQNSQSITIENSL